MKRLWILAAAVIAMAAYIYWIELPSRRAEDRRVEEESRALHFDVSEIQTIRVERDRNVMQLVFDGSEWRMLSPRQEPAESRRVQEFLRGLTAVERFRRITEGGEDALAYGLGRLSETAVTLQLEGKTSLTLEVGDLTPTGGACYFRRVGEEWIDVADAELYRLANLPPSNFRSTMVGAFSDSTLTQIGFAGQWVAERTPRRLWVLRDDPSVELRQWLVDEFVFDLVHTRIRDYVREDVEEREFAAYGLLPPALEVFWADAGGDSGTLALGNDAEDPGMVFARRSGHQDVLLVPGQLLDRGRLAPEEWIDRNPIDEDFKSMVEVEVELDDGLRARARGPKAFDLRAVLPAGSTRDPEDLHIAIRNVYYGLARFDALGMMEFASPEEARRAIERWAATVWLRWPDHERRLRLGWNGSGETHWIQLDDEARLHQVERDLFFRLQGWAMSSNSGQ